MLEWALVDSKRHSRLQSRTMSTHDRGELPGDAMNGGDVQNRSSPAVRFITRKWPPAMGGMETYCRELAQRLDQRLPLEVWALPGRANGAVPSAAALIWFGLRSALRLIAAPRVDVVHAGDLAIWPLVWLAVVRRPGTQAVLSVHGSDVNFANGGTLRRRAYRAYLWLGARLLPRARFIANSGWIASLLREQGFRNVRIVPLATTMRALTVPDGHNGTLLFAGRIMPSKGLGFLVREVMPLLDPPLGIRVAGAVWDEAEAELLQAPNVTYLGVLDPDALAREYGAAVATLIPSLTSEGFGLVAAEAAACGAVVVASDHSGLAEVVRGDIGLLAPAGDAPAWAARIAAICGWTDSARRAHVNASLAHAHARFSWDRVAEETIAAYTAD